jgi:serine/threonine protein kinase
MIELQPGKEVELTDGKKAAIVKELGRGGQGIVYLVNIEGKNKALKWYLNPMGDSFYKNLEWNVHNGAPSDAFLWPENLTVRYRNGHYGYVMALRPSNYREFSNYLLARVKFKSFRAIMAAAIKICDGFMMLHRSGYSYQDLNDGNFFIDPDTGDVLICDNDNVMPQGEKSGIMGKARYMAPEIVAGGVPDKYSDRFSLSVILFMLFFGNHPLEGAKVAACPCLTEAYEKKFYGREAVFIYDPVRNSNRPVLGVHRNVIRRWPIFPELLRDTFMQQFSEERLKKRESRLIESEWRKIIIKTRDMLVRCPHCGEETFINTSTHKCMNCGNDIDDTRRLNIGDRTICLVPGSGLFIDSDNLPDARVFISPADASMFLVQNITDGQWTAETPSGKIKQVDPKGYIPVKKGIKISFSATSTGELVTL